MEIVWSKLFTGFHSTALLAFQTQTSHLFGASGFPTSVQIRTLLLEEMKTEKYITYLTVG
jgi:hypothetical protein